MPVISKERYERAVEADEAIRELYATYHTTWVELGLHLTVMKDQGLWQALGFASFDQWRESVGLLHSTCYEIWGTVSKLLKAGLSKGELLQISKQNAKILVNLPERLQTDGEVLENAKNMSEAQFKSYAESRTTGSEARDLVRVVLIMERTFKEAVYDLALRTAKEQENTESNATALEKIVADWLVSQTQNAQEV